MKKDKRRKEGKTKNKTQSQIPPNQPFKSRAPKIISIIRVLQFLVTAHGIFA